MPGFVSYLIAVLLLAVVFTAISFWGRSRPRTMTTCTNRILFAIIILLFAVVFKLVSSGMDIVVLIIALVGLGVGWYGISAEPRREGVS